MSRNFDVLTTDRFSELSPQKVGEPLGEEIMGLARNIFASTSGLAQRQILFCGVDAENGSSVVSSDTARALLEIGATSVCLVDGDARSQILSRSFGVEPMSFPAKGPSILEQCRMVDDKLWLAGVELLVDDRGALLPAVELMNLLKELRGIFEYVVIDAPALSVCGDATTLGQVTGAVVLVVEANRTRRQTALRAKETLEAAGVRLLGAVLRNRTFPLPERLFKRL